LAVYDTAKIKNAATAIRQLADCLENDVKAVINSTTQGRDTLRGRAAEAMEERRMQLVKTASAIGQDMEALARHINTYAEMLKEADEQLAEKL